MWSRQHVKQVPEIDRERSTKGDTNGGLHFRDHSKQRFVKKRTENKELLFKLQQPCLRNTRMSHRQSVYPKELPTLACPNQ